MSKKYGDWVYQNRNEQWIKRSFSLNECLSQHLGLVWFGLFGFMAYQSLTPNPLLSK